MVSVIIPTHNRAPLIQDAVQSVLDQDYANVELIVVDDGSTDDTRERLAPYMERIRYVYKDKAGVSAARNEGIRIARGELIAFQDSDDVYLPGKTQMEVRIFRQYPEIEFLVEDPICFNRDTMWGTGYGLAARRVKSRSPEPGLYIFAEDPIPQFALGNFMDPCALAMRANVFKKTGLFDLNLPRSQDIDLFFRLLIECQGAYVDRVTAAKWRPPGKPSIGLLDKMWGCGDMYRKWCGVFADNPLIVRNLRHTAATVSAEQGYGYLQQNRPGDARRAFREALRWSGYRDRFAWYYLMVSFLPQWSQRSLKSLKRCLAKVCTIGAGQTGGSFSADRSAEPAHNDLEELYGEAIERYRRHPGRDYER